MINGHMKNLFRALPRYFTVFLAVFFAVSFFALYESFRVYRAETELIAILRGASVSAESVASTVAQIPKTLDFYDRLREEHGNASDPWAGENSAERKIAWNRVVSSSEIRGSGVIRLSVVASDSDQATSLLDASVETLYGFSGRLYNRESEADIRLLEGTIVYPELPNGWFLVLLSFTIASAGAFLASSLLRNLSGFPALSNHFPKPLFWRDRFTFRARSSKNEGIRPVGSFTEISHGEEDSDIASTDDDGEATNRISEEIVRKEESKPANPAGDGSIAVPEEREVFPDNRPKENADEPKDIWEVSRLVPKSADRETPKKIREETMENSHRSDSGNLPGNLETIPAKDFAWGKLLSQAVGEGNDATDSNGVVPDTGERVTDQVTGSPENEPIREPTTEELKARLNQLLRGEN